MNGDSPKISGLFLFRQERFIMDMLRTEDLEGRVSGYWRCFIKAMDRTHQLLCEEDVSGDYGRIHAVKSMLYVAIEQAGMESDRLISAQELLRELLMLVALQVDPVQSERCEALRILEELKHRHHLV